MRLPITTIIITSLAVLAGCSNQRPDRPPPNALFITDITADGSKMFEYQLLGRSDQGKQGGGQGRRPPPDGGQRGDSSRQGKGGGNDDRREAMLDRSLEEKLAETGYCREGYLVLERSTLRGSMTLRGECKEAATDADRESFGTPAANTNYPSNWQGASDA